MVETPIIEAPFMATFARRLSMVTLYLVLAARLTGSQSPISTPGMHVTVLAGTRVACLELNQRGHCDRLNKAHNPGFPRLLT